MTRTTQVLEELLILILMLIISNKELGFESDSFQVLYLLHRLQKGTVSEWTQKVKPVPGFRVAVIGSRLLAVESSLLN